MQEEVELWKDFNPKMHTEPLYKLSFPEAQKKFKKSERDDKEYDKERDKQKDKRQKEALSLQTSHKSRSMRSSIPKTSNTKSTAKQLNAMLSLSDNDAGREKAFGNNLKQGKNLLAPKTEEKKELLIQKRLKEQGKIYGNCENDVRGKQKVKRPHVHSCIDGKEGENSQEREWTLSRGRDETSTKRERSKSSDRNKINQSNKGKGDIQNKFWQCRKGTKDDYVEPDPNKIETNMWKYSARKQ